MAVSIYEGRRDYKSSFVNAMILVNVAFTALVIFQWPLIASYIADPMGAAAGQAMSDRSRPDFIDYPYSLLWTMPLICALFAWLGMKSGWVSFSKFVSFFPTALTSLSCLWYQWMLGNVVIPDYLTWV